MTDLRYNDDSFARFVGGVVKHAKPNMTIDTDSGFVQFTLTNGQVFLCVVEEVTPKTSYGQHGQCTYHRIVRCPSEATHRYVRRAMDGSSKEEQAFVCAGHKMGDGKDGRPDYGWKDVTVIQLTVEPSEEDDRCEHDRSGIGRCPLRWTHLYVRSNWPNAQNKNEEARVCDRHKMGDGKDGRRNYGWTEVI